MKKYRQNILKVFLIGYFILPYAVIAQENDIPLQSKVAQMLLVGFRGTTSENIDKQIISDIADLEIGGVILFEYDAPSKSRPRNISSPEQLKKLIEDLQSHAKIPLWISIDQEGGNVNRLKTRYGFPDFVSPQYLGKIDNIDSTKFYAALTAEILSSLGFNLNFTPGVDLNVNPDCPVIGKIGRSFSDEPRKVVKHAEIWIEEQKKKNIVSCLKHFPGHGSSLNDTHLGIADVTETWSPEELIPFRELINKNIVDMIMTSHIFNANLDATYPATLSEEIITNILKNDLQFQGIIITDDLAMGAIADHYSLKETLKQAIIAGADLLCLSNNGYTYDPEITKKSIGLIMELISEGEITVNRVEESYQKLVKLKKEYQLF